VIALSSRELGVVKDILHRHISDREVWVFGSRAGKDHKKYSDLDLAIIGREPIPPQVMAILREDFSESKLPFKVDVVDWAETSSEFRELIRRKYEVIQNPISNS